MLEGGIFNRAICQQIPTNRKAPLAVIFSAQAKIDGSLFVPLSTVVCLELTCEVAVLPFHLLCVFR